MGFIPTPQSRLPANTKQPESIKTDYSKGVTVIRPKTGLGSERSLNRSYQYTSGSGGKSNKQLYEEIYGTAEQQRILSEAAQKQDIAASRQAALSGPKISAVGKYSTPSKTRQSSKYSQDIPMSDLKAQLNIPQSSTVITQQREPLYQKGGVTPVTGSLQNDMGLTKRYAESSVELGGQPMSSRNVPFVADVERHAIQTPINQQSSMQQGGPRVMGGGVLPNTITSFETITQPLFKPKSEIPITEKIGIGKIGATSGTLGLTSPNNIQQKYKDYIETKEVESVDKDSGGLIGAFKALKDKTKDFIERPKTVTPETKTGAGGIAGAFSALKDVSKKIIKKDDNKEWFEKDVDSQFKKELEDGAILGSPVLRTSKDLDVAKQFGDYKDTKNLSDNEFAGTMSNFGKNKNGKTTPKKEKETKEFKGLINLVKTKGANVIDKGVDVLVARKVVMFNAKVDKYNKGNIFERNLETEKKLEIERGQLEAYLRKKKPDVNVDRILVSISRSSGGAIDESVLLKSSSKVPDTTPISFPTYPRHETISTGGPGKVDTTQAIAQLKSSPFQYQYLTPTQKAHQEYMQETGGGKFPELEVKMDTSGRAKIWGDYLAAKDETRGQEQGINAIMEQKNKAIESTIEQMNVQSAKIESSIEAHNKMVAQLNAQSPVLQKEEKLLEYDYNRIQTTKQQYEKNPTPELYGVLMTMINDYDKRSNEYNFDVDAYNKNKEKTDITQEKISENIKSFKDAQKDLDTSYEDRLEALDTYKSNIKKIDSTDKLKQWDTYFKEITESSSASNVKKLKAALTGKFVGAAETGRNVGEFLVAAPLRELKEDVVNKKIKFRDLTTPQITYPKYLAKGIYDWDKEDKVKDRPWTQNINWRAAEGALDTAFIIAGGVGAHKVAKPVAHPVLRKGLKAGFVGLGATAIVGPPAYSAITGQQSWATSLYDVDKVVGKLATVVGTAKLAGDFPLAYRQFKLPGTKGTEITQAKFLALKTGHREIPLVGRQTTHTMMRGGKEIRFMRTPTGQFKYLGKHTPTNVWFSGTPSVQLSKGDFRPYVEIGKNIHYVNVASGTTKINGKTYKLVGNKVKGYSLLYGKNKIPVVQPGMGTPQLSDIPIMEKALKGSFLPQSEKAKLSAIKPIRETGFYKEPGKFKVVVRKTKGLNEDGIRVVEQWQKDISTQYGSYGFYQQTTPRGTWQKYRGQGEVPGDIDKSIRLREKQLVAEVRDYLVPKLRASGNTVRIAKGKETLVEVFVPGKGNAVAKVGGKLVKGTWVHGVDAHSLDIPLAELKSLEISQSGSYAGTFTGKTTKAEGLKFMTEGESFARKGSSAYTLRMDPKGGQFYLGPEPVKRGKDVKDMLMLAEDIAKRSGSKTAITQSKQLKQVWGTEWLKAPAKGQAYAVLKGAPPDVLTGLTIGKEFQSGLTGEQSMASSALNKYKASKYPSSFMSGYYSPSMKSFSASPSLSKSISPSPSAYSASVSPSPSVSPSVSSSLYSSSLYSSSASPSSSYYSSSISTYPSTSITPAPAITTRGSKFGSIAAFGGFMPRGSRRGKRGRGVTGWTVTNPLKDLPGEFLARQRAKSTGMNSMLGKSSDINKKLKTLI